MKKLILIEDDLDFADTLSFELSERGLDVQHFTHIENPEQIPENFDYAIVDLRLQDSSGLDTLETLRNHSPKAIITMLSAFGSVASTVEAMKKGSDNFLMKPCSIEEILVALKIEQTTQDIPPSIPDLYQREREYIDFILQMHGGNISKAADTLGIKRQSLQRKLKKFIPKKL